MPEETAPSLPSTRSPRPSGFWVKGLAIVALVGCIVALVVQGYGLQAEIAESHRQAIATGEDQVQSIADYFQLTAALYEQWTQELARDLETGKVTLDNLKDRLKQDSLRDRGILGFTVAYAPFAAKPDQRLYAPYYDSDTDTFVQCEDFYDYSDSANAKDAVWYQAVAESGEPAWVSAFGPAAGSTYAGYSVPFFHAEKPGETKRLQGVVNVAISLPALTKLLNTRFVGRLGAGYMVNSDGVLLAAPNQDSVRAGRTWEEVLRSSPAGNEQLYQLARDFAGGKTGHYRFKDYAGIDPPQSGWFFYQPVAPADWRLGVAIFENELYRNDQSLRRRVIWIALTVLIGLTLLPFLFMKTRRLDLRQMSLAVVIFTLAGAATIGLIWDLTKQQRIFESLDGDRERTITDLQGVESFVAERRAEAEKLHIPPPVLIPTRLLIRGLEFDDAYHVKVSGIITQTYPREGHDALQKGVTFVNVAPDAEALALDEIYREETDEFEVIAWSFRATIKQQFDYRNFPFDRQQIALTLRHVDETENVLLVPELESYRFLNTSARPGVYRELTIPGWNLQGSYFRYQIIPQVVERGLINANGLGSYSELSYVLAVRRKFLTPFISYIVPILIVIVLLFGVVIVSSINLDKQSATGFNVFGALGTCGAFFFTIALMHIDLRDSIQAEVVTYLEWLYFVAYGLLVLVSLNALLFIATDWVHFIEYRDNLIPKLFYWPLFTVLMLVVTLMTFY